MYEYVFTRSVNKLSNKSTKLVYDTVCLLLFLPSSGWLDGFNINILPPDMQWHHPTTRNNETYENRSGFGDCLKCYWRAFGRFLDCVCKDGKRGLGVLRKINLLLDHKFFGPQHFFLVQFLLTKFLTLLFVNPKTFWPKIGLTSQILDHFFWLNLQT